MRSSFFASHAFLHPVAPEYTGDVVRDPSMHLEGANTDHLFQRLERIDES